jgi:hypothetical protein
MKTKPVLAVDCFDEQSHYGGWIHGKRLALYLTLRLSDRSNNGLDRDTPGSPGRSGRDCSKEIR